ncbi:MAG: hypothetical protein AABZ57_01770, partial [Candidatus Margulisiibacteriota bacterium]
MPITGEYRYGRAEFARTPNLLSALKLRELSRISGFAAERLLQEAIWVIDRYPIFGNSIDQARYELQWRKVSSTLVSYLDSRELRNVSDFEGMLAVSCLAQRSWTAMSVASISFSEMMRRSASFEEALGYLEKYEHLPHALIHSGIEILMDEKAAYGEHFAALNAWTRKTVDGMLSSRENVAAFETAKAFMRYFRGASRLEVLSAMLSTGESDRRFKELAADAWFRAGRVTDNIKSLDDKIDLGNFKVSFFAIDHAIMDAVGVILETPVATVVHPGDWTIEKDPIGRDVLHYHHLAKLKRPTILMLEAIGAINTKNPVT